MNKKTLFVVGAIVVVMGTLVAIYALTSRHDRLAVFTGSFIQIYENQKAVKEYRPVSGKEILSVSELHNGYTLLECLEDKYICEFVELDKELNVASKREAEIAWQDRERGLHDKVAIYQNSDGIQGIWATRQEGLFKSSEEQVLFGFHEPMQPVSLTGNICNQVSLMESKVIFCRAFSKFDTNLTEFGELFLLENGEVSDLVSKDVCDCVVVRFIATDYGIVFLTKSNSNGQYGLVLSDASGNYLAQASLDELRVEDIVLSLDGQHVVVVGGELPLLAFLTEDLERTGLEPTQIVTAKSVATQLGLEYKDILWVKKW